MAAANQWNVINLNLNEQNGILNINGQHVILNHFSLLITPPPPGGGVHTIEFQKLQLMALALAKRDPFQIPNMLDQVVIGDHKLDLGPTMRILGVAINAGFLINITPGPLHTNYEMALQSAMVWAQQPANTLLLDVLNVNDFGVLPVIAAANHNHYRFHFTIGMFVSGGLFHPLVDFLAIMGYIHSAASRGNNSRFAEVVIQEENFVAGAINITPSMRSVMIAQTFTSFSLPLTWRHFPHTTNFPDAEVVACLRQRFYADHGLLSNRRLSFMVSLSGILAPGRYPVLRRFLQPASSDNESLQAYDAMVQHLLIPAGSETTFYTEHMVSRLDTEILPKLIDVADSADRAVPIRMALQRANTAILTFQQRTAAIQNTPLNSGSDTSGGNSVSRAQKAELHNLLSVLTWFGPFILQVEQLYTANSTNELPIINAALNTRNVAVYQVVTGKVRGVSDLHVAWRIMESIASRFINFVSYCVCMLPTGVRPPHTLSYHFESGHLNTFLSGDREKFLKLPIVDICIGIKKARDQLAQYSVNISAGFFESPEIFELLRVFQYFLDIFRFRSTGPGSWDEALNRIAEFRTTGICLPPAGRVHHMANVKQLYDTLLNDFFDNVLPFTGQLDGALVTVILSDRVYEANGVFDRQMAYQIGQTSSLNGLLNLNPALAGLMSYNGKMPKTEDDDSGKSGGKFSEKSPGQVKTVNGFVLFGKGPLGPKYSSAKCMELVKTIFPGANRGNFCLEAFLSKFNKCSNGKHGKSNSAHKFKAELLAIREQMESKPYRVDSKAK